MDMVFVLKTWSWSWASWVSFSCAFYASIHLWKCLIISFLRLSTTYPCRMRHFDQSHTSYELTITMVTSLLCWYLYRSYWVMRADALCRATRTDSLRLEELMFLHLLLPYFVRCRSTWMKQYSVRRLKIFPEDHHSSNNKLAEAPSSDCELKRRAA